MVNINVIEEKIKELQEQLKKCSDWEYWDIQQELTFWKAKHCFERLININ